MKLVERHPANYQEAADEIKIEGENNSIRTLGVKWGPIQDHFSVAKLDEKVPTTKVEILSEITRFFDPLGWLSPLTIHFKSFVQLLQTDRLGWDIDLSKSLQQQYSLIRFELKDLEDTKLPKKTVPASPTLSDMEPYVFFDPSATAHAAVVYLGQTLTDSVQTRMLRAKTIVVPIKNLCVSRLDLCAALFGANLVESVISALHDQRFWKPNVYAWTDSILTLA